MKISTFQIQSPCRMFKPVVYVQRSSRTYRLKSRHVLLYSVTSASRWERVTWIAPQLPGLLLHGCVLRGKKARVYQGKLAQYDKGLFLMALCRLEVTLFSRSPSGTQAPSLTGPPSPGAGSSAAHGQRLKGACGEQWVGQL